MSDKSETTKDSITVGMGRQQKRTRKKNILRKYTSHLMVSPYTKVV